LKKLNNSKFNIETIAVVLEFYRREHSYNDSVQGWKQATGWYNATTEEKRIEYSKINYDY
jgi:hypothetical protein